MQYQALYRKYRPQRFDEVVGQDHVTTTLAREVVEDKVAHAYLFTGPRGTGKTTSARLLAKSLNCPNRAADGEPCNTCPSCVGITEGTSLDVIELDAASHNKVEDVREIRANVSTVAAAAGAKRVYILDEAHMLSRAAGNALLKTLEEPPDHVIFVLATTEPYKLLDTIRSRSQRFDFHPVPTETLVDYLAKIADAEGFTHDHAALSAVTAHAGGSVRDAMSLLEQVAALGAGAVTTAGVERALGLADRDSFRKLIDAMVDTDAAAGLELIANLTRQGSDLRRFVADAIAYMRGVFLAQYAPNLAEIVDASSETIDEWQQVAPTIPSTDVLRAIDVLSVALTDLRDGREERLVVEMAIIRLTRPEVVADVESVSARLARVERSVEELRAAPKPTPAPARDLPADRPFEKNVEPVEDDPATEQVEAAVVPADDTREVEAPTIEVADEAASTFKLSDFNRVWPSVAATIRTEVGPRRHALLREATPVAVEGGAVVFEVASHMHFHLEQLKADKALQEAITSHAGDQLGAAVAVRFQSADAPAADSTGAMDLELVPDKDSLVSADDDEADDPAAMLQDALGGEFVDQG